MNLPDFIVTPELIDLYEKISLYIISNYPACVITVNEKSVAFGYPNEFTRIFLYQDKEQTYLILKITQDLTQPMGVKNGLLYKIKDTDDIQHIKSGIKVILECRVPKFIIESRPAPVVAETSIQDEPQKQYSKPSIKDIISQLKKGANDDKA